MDATPNNELELDERTARLRRQNVTRVLRHRRRKREGMRILQIEVSNRISKGFVGLGVLTADRRNDSAAIEAAIATLCRAGCRAISAGTEKIR